MRKITVCLFVLGVAVVSAALIIASAVVTAQNSNSSTTMTETKPKAKPKPKPAVSRCDPEKHEEADLSGTYTGTIDYPEAGMTGDATLTITGKEFTLTAGSTTQSGRITAETTCGYTGATMMFGDLTPPKPGPNPPAALPAVSLQAKRVGGRVTVVSVPGEKRQFKFGEVVKKPEPKKRRAAPPPPSPQP